MLSKLEFFSPFYTRPPVEIQVKTLVGQQAGLSPDCPSASLQPEALHTDSVFHCVSKCRPPSWPAPFLGGCPNLDTWPSGSQECSPSCPVPDRINDLVPVLECNSTVCSVVPWPGPPLHWAQASYWTFCLDFQPAPSSGSWQEPEPITQ